MKLPVVHVAKRLIAAIAAKGDAGQQPLYAKIH